MVWLCSHAVLLGKQFSSCGIVSVGNYATVDLCTNLSSELNILACNSSSICLCYAAMQRRRLLHYIQNFFDRRRMFWVLEIFTWILISDILVLIIVFFVGQRSCYFEADSPWWSSYFEADSPCLEDYRSSHLLVEDYRGSCLLVEDYRGSYLLVGGLSSFLLVWLALQVLLLAAEACFNWFFNRYCSRLCGRLFGVIYAAFPSGYFVVKAVSYLWKCIWWWW